MLQRRSERDAINIERSLFTRANMLESNEKGNTKRCSLDAHIRIVSERDREIERKTLRNELKANEMKMFKHKKC